VTSVNLNSNSEVVQDANLLVAFADLKTSTGWYYFQVASITDIGQSQFCQSATIIADAQPNAVTNLSASNLDQNGSHASGTVTLSWDYQIDNSCPLLGYIVNYLMNLIICNPFMSMILIHHQVIQLMDYKTVFHIHFPFSH
jgi:hypothetical protein